MKRIAILALMALPLAAQTSKDHPRLPVMVAVTQKLGNIVPLNAMMRDEAGRVVTLGDYFKSGRPVLLNFVYYHCPMLCPMGLEGLSSSLTELKFNIGEEFDIVTISMDPRDKPAEAAQFKD